MPTRDADRGLATLRATASRRSDPATGLLVLALLAAGALLRVLDLRGQGYWYDEAYTAYLVSLSPRALLQALPSNESSPPLYYLVAWVWSRAFGSAETGLRSLSMTAGLLTVPVMYHVGRELATRRAGLIAAALTAASPLLIWYSQEARAYALLVLLSAAALFCFARALRRPARGALVGWFAFSSLALATHYMAALTIAPMAAALLRRERGARLAVAGTAVVAAALLPLALSQLSTKHSAWIAKIPFGVRLGQLPEQFVLGFGATPLLLALVAAGLMAGLGVWLRRERPMWGAADIAGGVAAGGLGLALMLAALGADEILTRNLIALWPPLAAALAVAFAAATRHRPIGLLATGLVCAAGVAADLRIDDEAALERPDWRPLLRVLGPAHATRLLVLEHYPGQLPLRLYDRSIRRLPNSLSATANEVDVVAAHVPSHPGCWWGSACNLSPAKLPPAPPSGFRLRRRADLRDFRIARFVARRPVTVSVGGLKRELVHVGSGAVLREPPVR